MELGFGASFRNANPFSAPINLPYSALTHAHDNYTSLISLAPGLLLKILDLAVNIHHMNQSGLFHKQKLVEYGQIFNRSYRTHALLGARAYISTGSPCVPNNEVRLTVVAYVTIFYCCAY